MLAKWAASPSMRALKTRVAPLAKSVACPPSKTPSTQTRSPGSVGRTWPSSPSILVVLLANRKPRSSPEMPHRPPLPLCVPESAATTKTVRTALGVLAVSELPVPNRSPGLPPRPEDS